MDIEHPELENEFDLSEVERRLAAWRPAAVVSTATGCCTKPAEPPRRPTAGSNPGGWQRRPWSS